ncbi:hypothetical protein LCI18_003474 [Fusarium solani-melongenae]|uniref:Uncharacterized protein n=1 Tax=Fusarium solani subsp. cucurbitae TaxID=2747967 RepID=A0ACD3YU77_FUSSC|nr:hypothetical protein LCI18_003474 [Fusarium solani-melongenae]
MSLRSLGLEHPWLLTHPIFWTAQHLDLVKCRFEESVGGDGDGLERSSNHAGVETGLHAVSNCDEASTQTAKIFAKTLALVHKTYTLVSLLEYNGSPLEWVRDPPVFVFAKRSIDRSECTVFHIAKHCMEEWYQDALPIIGYLDYRYIILKRRKKLKPRPHPSKGYNGPVQRLCQRKLSEVTPQTWSRDRYLARLLVTIKSEQDYVHLFEAAIPSKLLDIPDDPTLSMEHVPWPTIQHSKLPFQPYSTFQMRLMTRLVEVQGGQGSLCMEPTNFEDSKGVSNKRKATEESELSRKVMLKG